MNQLNLIEGEKRKRYGMEKVKGRNLTWLSSARYYARRIARSRGQVTADDLRSVMYGAGLFPTHPNAWGSVFKGYEWEFTGEWRKSRVPSRHASMVRVWRLRQ